MSQLVQETRPETSRPSAQREDGEQVRTTEVLPFQPIQIPAVWWMPFAHPASALAAPQQLPLVTRVGKRLLDIVVSSILLVVLAPVMLLVAVAVWLSSPGPIIFRQTRVGLNLRTPGQDRRQQAGDPPAGFPERRGTGTERRRDFAYGRHFTLYKFRTMRSDAEKDGARFAVAGDSRVTPLGRLLRKTRLDELPQLWNVLKGEMSLVGPRPERPEFMQELSAKVPRYLDRLGLKPGLTGVAQILNGYDNELEGFRRKIAYDLFYLANCSLLNDLGILVRTIWVILTGSGAL